MALTDLTEMEILLGSTSLINVLFAIILGLKIAFKYSEVKRKEFISAGISTIFMMSGHVVYAFSFLTYVLFDFIISHTIVLFLGSSIALIAVMCWIYTISILLYPNSIKRILTIFFIVCLLWEIFLIYFLLTDMSIIGIVLGKFDIKVNIFGFLLVIFALMTLIITMSLFTYKSLKSDDKVLQWRGRFLMMGAILFIIGMTFDMRFATTSMIVVIARIIMISSTIFLYIGWLLPKRIAYWLIKEDPMISENVNEQKGDVQEFLQLVKSRPEKLTEKEITFFRERKICLVCKGKVEGFSFICKCDAMYCQKCAQVLTNMDNMCWACNGPIDPKKPVISYEKEDDIEIKVPEDQKTER